MSGGRFDLSGRIACVTGASAGIGRAIATAFAETGATVVGVARREAQLDDWRGAVEARDGRAHACVADLADLTTVPEAAERITAAAGAPDILVNAAGLNPRQQADVVTAEAWQKTLDLNLSAPFFLAQALVPGMRAKGWGRVINIASLQSERAFPNGIAYGASKGGVTQLTRAMAEAWSRDGITCNALAPGFFPTELTSAVFADEERSARNAAQTCIGRNGRLDDLVGPAIFLASPASDYVTGQILFVDGGFTAK
ncbi:SDR family NAD(P)-dependent oxidoreductase [Pelagibius sp.]|uniref:SDR family NAD(P)-dependent oxidoreductase n=1 Tax=Pelagibius sp. TaxID=1931238 RepID=UPI00262DA17F|nr:SDR family oxidoreductase [Pelagibius sp.]